MGILISKATSNKIATQPSLISDEASQLSSEIASRPNAHTIESIRSSIQTLDVAPRYADPKVEEHHALSEKGSSLLPFAGKSIRVAFANTKLPSAA
jgi:hypothetical protein